MVPEPPAPELPATDEDAQAATVFMSPPLVSEPSDAGTGATIEEEQSSSEAEDPDATWQVPSATPAAVPPAQVDAEFVEAPLPPPPVAAAAPPAESPTIAIPVEAPLAGDPFSAPTGDDVAQPIPSIDTQVTMVPEAVEADAFPPMTPPTSPEPSPSDPPAPVMTEPETPFAPVEAPAAELPVPVPPEPPGPVAPLDVTLPAPEPAASSGPETPEATGGDDDLVERIAQRVVDKLSAKVIQEIAWEVVPDLAEGLIQKEIDALKSRIQKSG